MLFLRIQNRLSVTDSTERYHIAGRNRLLKERRLIGELEIGQAGITDAFSLPARYIIHAVSPGWIDGDHEEENLLKTCYENALNVAVKHNCRIVIFPLLSTGVLHFPWEKALTIAKTSCAEYSEQHPQLDIILVIYDIYEKRQAYGQLDQYIMENNYADFNLEEYRRMEKTVEHLPRYREEWEIFRIMQLQLKRKTDDQKKRLPEYSLQYKPQEIAETRMQYNYTLPAGNLDKFIQNAPRKMTIEDLLDKYRKAGKFSSYRELCARSGLEEYTLSKLRKGVNKSISRDTLWALAIGMRLNIKETEELFQTVGLSIAGNYNFSSSDMTRELIFEWHIKYGIWDIDRINGELWQMGLNYLGNYFRDIE